jgi:hypothetical protein
LAVRTGSRGLDLRTDAARRPRRQQGIALQTHYWRSRSVEMRIYSDMYGNPRSVGFRALSHSDRVCRARFHPQTGQQTRSSVACRKTSVCRRAAKRRSQQNPWDPGRIHSRSVCLCSKNARSVRAGEGKGGGRGAARCRQGNASAGIERIMMVFPLRVIIRLALAALQFSVTATSSLKSLSRRMRMGQSFKMSSSAFLCLVLFSCPASRVTS